MSAFIKTTTKTSSQEEQKPFVVPTNNNGRWRRVSRPQQQQGRYQRRPQQQGRRPQQQGRRPQQQGRRPYRPQNKRRFNNNRRRNYRKKQLTPQKGTRIATGSLLDMAMTKASDGRNVVKIQSRKNGKRVLKHASLNEVLMKKREFKDSNNSFSALDQKETTIRKLIPRPTVVNTVIAPQGKWGAPLSSAVTEEKEFSYLKGSELEKQHLERLDELEEEKLAKQELDRQIRTGQYEIDSWADEMDGEDEDDFQENRKLGEGYDLSCQPDVDDEHYESYWDAHDEDEEHYNHQAEIAQLDGWYD